MKNAILCLLAFVAVTLSLAFRVAPAPSVPAPAHLAASVTASASGIPHGSGPQSAAFGDSLFYGFYSQELGVELNHEADKSLIETVARWLGAPYRSGGSTPFGTDCSGFVMRAYQQAYGITLVHSSGGLFQRTARVKRTEMREGDLVFFRRSRRSPIYHVGIYLRDGKFVHSQSHVGVKVSSLREGYWGRNYCGAGRVELPAAVASRTN
ncbi:MAG: C40 family peptidase [Hymenobacteraceae bacterium]|nr:C40 family peptidase [Hymenobacteraceae bacterium]